MVGRAPANAARTERVGDRAAQTRKRRAPITAGTRRFTHNVPARPTSLRACRTISAFACSAHRSSGGCSTTSRTRSSRSSSSPATSTTGSSRSSGQPDIYVGLMVAAVSLALIVTLPLIGVLADRIGHKPILIVFTLVCIVATGLLGVVRVGPARARGRAPSRRTGSTRPTRSTTRCSAPSRRSAAARASRASASRPASSASSPRWR